MTPNISDLQPKALWENFAKICSIPHPSGKEKQLAKFIKEFGEKLGLESIIDEANNVIIRKPATSGMENRKCVTLQSHLDMVPEKNQDVIHDFEKDPIQPVVDDGWVTAAKKTTLGADNGIGIAAIMAILQSKDIKHGPIEALFTTEEETTMAGTCALKPNVLKGDIFLNLDSEEDDTLYIGSAGGLLTYISLKYNETPVPEGSIALKIMITGLKGGHSGTEIHLGLGNANNLLGRFLWERKENFGLRLANICGGNAHNAITREAFAIITISQNKKDEFLKSLEQFELTIKNEIAIVDPNFHIMAEATEMPKFVIDEKTQNNFLNSIFACPSGVIGMSKDVPGLVETSTNLGVIYLEDSKIKIRTFQRSSVNSLIDNAGNVIASIFILAGAEIKFHDRFPGWKPNIKSPILQIVKNVYKNKFGKEPFIKAIHAGLECGFIKEKYPEMDMVSFGPNMIKVHTPEERTEIKSVALFWDLLTETLKNIPPK